MSKKTALITAIGSFSADIAIKTLHEMDFSVIGCDIFPASWVVDSANVDFFFQAPLVKNEEAYLAFLKDLCVRYEVSLLLPSIDLEVDLLCSHKEEFAALGTTLCLSDEEVIRLCRDKQRLPLFLEETDKVRRIPSYDVDSPEAASLSWPVILKPVDGRSSEGCHKVENAQGLAYFKDLLPGRHLLVQPFIAGSIITADVSCDGTDCVVCARRELLRTGNGAGTTVQILDVPELTEFCTRSALALGIRGTVNFEFIEGADGLYHFLEINPRFSGGIEFSHIAGIPMAKQHFRVFLGEKLLPCKAPRLLTIARKYEEFVMAENPEI